MSFFTKFGTGHSDSGMDPFQWSGNQMFTALFLSLSFFPRASAAPHISFNKFQRTCLLGPKGTLQLTDFHQVLVLARDVLPPDSSVSEGKDEKQLAVVYKKKKLQKDRSKNNWAKLMRSEKGGRKRPPMYCIHHGPVVQPRAVPQQQKEQWCGQNWQQFECSAVFTEGLAAALIQQGQARGPRGMQVSAGLPELNEANYSLSHRVGQKGSEKQLCFVFFPPRRQWAAA